MKVLLINGSAKKNRCTYTALEQAAEGLESQGIETEIYWIGNRAVRPCIDCGKCSTIKRCAFDDDCANEAIEKSIEADGIILGSPVYYAGVNGAFHAVLDRLFYAAGSLLAFKPGGSIVSARRAGTTTTLDQLNKYFLISQMPLVASFYWPMVHGQNPDQVRRDEEGIQVVRQLGENMAWLLKSIEAGRAAGVVTTQPEKRSWTNFIC